MSKTVDGIAGAEGLERCLHCQGRPTLHETDWCEPPEFSGHCLDCGASTKSSTNRAEAIAAWNRRAPTEEEARLRERVKELEEAVAGAIRDLRNAQKDGLLRRHVDCNIDLAVRKLGAALSEKKA